ncbi:hypothetical protein I6F30_25480 [Bradyrhizobium sp. NBAIM20]|uniref:hypothetical protein n=1 Tax=unclassified Bradyrhizobium TaxID=2631580 RepID=UPI001CD485CD|nr:MULTISPECIES: hypothetical protein [unclassified Bradyrhizobium]MCA1414478.1 hypothetical protein [Bradyrhizobium sp. NBAIM20]MCA1459860.1 hypothetical protein [Bradyrhizobium sp. NBAIM18]
MIDKLFTGLLFLLSGVHAMADGFSAVRGTLVIAIPTSAGLVVAADRRTTPRGIYCDGVRKILVPKPKGTAVFITGMATMRDTSGIADEELCETLRRTPAPIDFGRMTVDFVDTHTEPLINVDGQQLADAIFAEIRRYIEGGELQPFFGQQYVTTIVVASFDPESRVSRVWQFWVNFTGPVLFQLQPLPVRQFTLDDVPDIILFGENEYFVTNVRNGIGRQFLDGSIETIRDKRSIANVSVEDARKAGVNLIEAAAETASLIKPPSGIGGGVDCALVGEETRLLPH